MGAGPTDRPLREESDWELVDAARNGEDHAFEILVKRYKARILSLAFHITRNREDAQDVVKQSFQNAFVHLQKFQGESTFSIWLRRIAINEALMCLRKNRVSGTVAIEEVDPERDSLLSREICDASANREETYIRMEKTNSILHDRRTSADLAENVRLHLDDLTVEEMGQCLGVRTRAVKAMAVARSTESQRAL